MILLAKLLHLGNASPPLCYRNEFYALKKRLLERYAVSDGDDIQEIIHECYGPRYYAYDATGCLGAKCPKCGGTGVYAKRYYRLVRWRWGKYLFHVPSVDAYVALDERSRVTIRGRIEHRWPGRIAGEAVLWLYVFCGEWRLLWKSLTGSCACGWYLWPLLNVQRVTMNLSMWLAWRKCWCGRWFPTFGSGWCVCHRCRQPRPAEETDDLPF